MIGKTAVVAIFATLALVACSSTVSGSPEASSGPSGESSSGLTSQLLTLGDLPSGWTVDNSPDSDDASAPSCLKQLDVSTRSSAAVSASFIKGEGLPLLEQQLSAFADSGDTAAAYSSFTSILNKCTDLSFTTDGQLFTGTIAPLTFPNIGDQSKAWRMSFTAGGHELEMDLVLTQKGAELALFLYGNLGATDVDELATFASIALTKMP